MNKREMIERGRELDRDITIYGENKYFSALEFPRQSRLVPFIKVSLKEC
jgi:hypothetical protein